MVRGRLRSFVNIIQRPNVRVHEARASEVIAAGVRAYGVEWSMLLRVAVVCASIVGAGLLVAVPVVAEELGQEQARAFVVGKLFSYTCFEGTAGVGRIFADGSVVGTIRMRGQGQTRFAALPAGTIKVDGGSMCAHLPGLPITPCFKVDRIDYKSFRGSVSGLGFAYCDFNQRNPRTQLINGPSEQPAATPINSRPVLRPSLQE
jgi:hypothetical protein